MTVAYHGVATAEHQTSLSKRVPSLDGRPGLRPTRSSSWRRQELRAYGDAPLAVNVVGHELPPRRCLALSAPRRPRLPGSSRSSRRRTPKYVCASQHGRRRRLRRDGWYGGPDREVGHTARSRSPPAQMQASPAAHSKPTKPVAIFGGNQCTNLPEKRDAPAIRSSSKSRRCTSGHRRTRRFRTSRGARRSTARRARPKTCSWEIMGANEGTTLTYDPAPPVGALAHALHAGERVFFTTDQLFSVKSQDAAHLIYLAVYMSSASVRHAGRSGLRERRPERSVPRSLRLLRGSHSTATARSRSCVARTSTASTT